MRISFALASVMCLLAGCVGLADQSETDLVRINVSSEGIASDTKVMLEGNGTVWNAGDEASVFYRCGENGRWVFEGEDRASSGVLVGRMSRLKESCSDSIVAVYPYNPSTSLEGDSVRAFLPCGQPFEEDSYGSCVMCAVSEKDDLHFRYASAVVALEIKGEASIESIVFRGGMSETVAGGLDILLSGLSVTPCVESGDTVVTVSKSDGSMIDICGDRTVFVSVIPQVFRRGFRFTLNMADGSAHECGTSFETILKPGEMTRLETSVEEELVLDIRFSDGTARSNPFMMSSWPSADMVTGELLGPFHLAAHPFDYPFGFFIRRNLGADSFRITNGGGLRFGGTEGDYILLPPVEGMVLSEVCVEQSSLRIMHVTPDEDGADPVIGGEAREGSAIFCLKGTKSEASYRLAVREDNYGGIYRLKLIYKKSDNI